MLDWLVLTASQETLGFFLLWNNVLRNNSNCVTSISLKIGRSRRAKPQHVGPQSMEMPTPNPFTYWLHVNNSVWTNSSVFPDDVIFMSWPVVLLRCEPVTATKTAYPFTAGMTYLYHKLLLVSCLFSFCPSHHVLRWMRLLHWRGRQSHSLEQLITIWGAALSSIYRGTTSNKHSPLTTCTVHTHTQTEKNTLT